MRQPIRWFLVALFFTLAYFCSFKVFGADLPHLRRQLKTSRPRLLRGSRASLASENAVANKFKMQRFKTLEDLRLAVKKQELFVIANSRYVEVRVGENDPLNSRLYSFAQVQVRRFVDTSLRDGQILFGQKFVVTSLVRTEQYQRSLLADGEHPTAAKSNGPWQRSSHLTGATLDISKKDLAERPKRWLRRELVRLEQCGLVLATEEIRGNCFHVMVKPSYSEFKMFRCR